MNTHITDAQVDAACAKLRKIIEAAEASNQAGEDAVVCAAAGQDLLGALTEMVFHYGNPKRDEWLNDEAFHMAKACADRAIAIIAKAEGRTP